MAKPWKSDPEARKALAEDAVLIGPVAAAKKHDASRATAQRMANEARAPMTPEQMAQVQIETYEKLQNIRESASSLIQIAFAELLKDDAARLREFISTTDDLTNVGKLVHDLARTIEVTLPKVNFLTGLGPGTGVGQANLIQINAPGEQKQIEYPTVKLDKPAES